jgi:hypothetical protein
MDYKAYIGKRVSLTLRGVTEGASESSMEADLFAVDGQHGLAVFRTSRPTTFMKADYVFIPLVRCSNWAVLGEGEKIAVTGAISETVMRQRYEASRKKEEEVIECTSEHATELEHRFFMELRKSCVAATPPTHRTPPTHGCAFFPPHRSQPLPFIPPPFTPRHPRAKWQGRNILVDDQGTLLPHPYAAMDTSKSTINDMGKKFLEQVLEKARKATGYTV